VARANHLAHDVDPLNLLIFSAGGGWALTENISPLIKDGCLHFAPIYGYL
jgi:hypothetical protein